METKIEDVCKRAYYSSHGDQPIFLLSWILDISDELPKDTNIKVELLNPESRNDEFMNGVGFEWINEDTETVSTLDLITETALEFFEKTPIIFVAVKIQQPNASVKLLEGFERTFSREKSKRIRNKRCRSIKQRQQK